MHKSMTNSRTSHKITYPRSYPHTPPRIEFIPEIPKQEQPKKLRDVRSGQPTIYVVCSAIIEKDGKFLMLKAARKDVRGRWNFPCGKMKIGENIFSATLREIKEETKLDVKLDGLIGIYEFITKRKNTAVYFLFKASVTGGRIRLRRREAIKARWFTLKEFIQLKDDELRGEITKKFVEDYIKKKPLPLDVIYSQICTEKFKGSY